LNISREGDSTTSLGSLVVSCKSGYIYDALA